MRILAAMTAVTMVLAGVTPSARAGVLSTAPYISCPGGYIAPNHGECPPPRNPISVARAGGGGGGRGDGGGLLGTIGRLVGGLTGGLL